MGTAKKPPTPPTPAAPPLAKDPTTVTCQHCRRHVDFLQTKLEDGFRTCDPAKSPNLGRSCVRMVATAKRNRATRRLIDESAGDETPSTRTDP